MNELFVNVKVDREERPDVDAIYMQAVQALTGRGGWPMTVFLDPDGRPFFGGTYFPNDDRHGMPGVRARAARPSPRRGATGATTLDEQAEQLTDAIDEQVLRPAARGAGALAADDPRRSAVARHPRASSTPRAAASAARRSSRRR